MVIIININKTIIVVLLITSYYKMLLHLSCTITVVIVVSLDYMKVH